VTEATVEIRAHAFERFGRPLAGAWIAVRERPELRLLTGRDGRVRLAAAVGSTITAIGGRPGCQTLQAATVIVPAEGLCGADRAITLQVPLALTFWLLQRLLTRPRAGCHHLATTITAAGKTLVDSPQGEPGAEVVLRRVDGAGDCGDAPIYLGAVPLIHKTEFARAVLAARGVVAPLRRSSVDGGVLIANVPRGRYTLTARKPGVRFSAVEVVIAEDSPSLVNVSPPHAPRVMPG
jgi:hypothetical protein